VVWCVCGCSGARPVAASAHARRVQAGGSGWCVGVVVLRHSSSWLLFAADLCEVTDVGLQAFSGAVASSPTLTTVTIRGARVDLTGRVSCSMSPECSGVCGRVCPGARPVAASAHAWRGQGGGRGGCAGVVVLRHSSSWLLFVVDLPRVTDVGLQAFSGAVASSPTLTTVTIECACVGSGGSCAMHDVPAYSGVCAWLSRNPPCGCVHTCAARPGWWYRRACRCCGAGPQLMIVGV